MKYIFIVLCFISFCFSFETSFGMTYRDNISINKNPERVNTTSNINRAKLLCTHINKFDDKIQKLVSKHGLNNDERVKKTFLLIEKMKQSCSIITTKNIEKSDADQIITSIVKDLSVINTGIKKHLKKEIQKIYDYHNSYGKKAYTVALWLDRFITKLTNYLERKSTITKKEKEIFKHIKNLRGLSKKLKEFESIPVYRKDEIRASLIRIVKEIRKEIKALKEL